MKSAAAVEAAGVVVLVAVVAAVVDVAAATLATNSPFATPGDLLIQSLRQIISPGALTID